MSGPSINSATNYDSYNNCNKLTKMFLAINSFLTRLLLFNYLEQVSVEVIPPQSTDRELSLMLEYIKEPTDQSVSKLIN